MKKILSTTSLCLPALLLMNFAACEKESAAPAAEVPAIDEAKKAPVAKPAAASQPNAASKPATDKQGALEKKRPGTTADTRDHADEDGVIRRGVKLSTTAALDVSKVAKKADELSGKIVKVSGDVSKVCTKKGCWFAMTSKDKKEEIRITAKDYGFFVPSAAVGKKAIVEGILEVKTMTQEEARHMAKDGGKDEKTINAIEGEQKELRLVSQSLEMRG